MPDTEWLLNEDKGFVFFFRPRCGSTTLTRWFFENMGYTFGGFSIARFRVEWMESRRDRLEEVLETQYDSLHKFVVIRNPYDRAVSSYLHAVNNPRDYQWNVIRPKLEVEKAKDELTFRDYVDFLFKDDLDTTTTIWRRQSALPCWERGVDDAVPLDGMDEYLLALNKRYGFEIAPSMNSVTVSSFDAKDVEHQLFADTAFAELLRYKGKAYFEKFPPYTLFYDDELQEAVARLYEVDIDIFNRSLGRDISAELTRARDSSSHNEPAEVTPSAEPRKGLGRWIARLRTR